MTSLASSVKASGALSIPNGLATLLPNSKTPGEISPDVFERQQKQAVTSSKPFGTRELSPKAPKDDSATRFFLTEFPAASSTPSVTIETLLTKLFELLEIPLQLYPILRNLFLIT